MADKEKAQYNFKAFTDLFPGNNESMSSKSSKTDKKKIHLNTFDDITTKQTTQGMINTFANQTKSAKALKTNSNSSFQRSNSISRTSTVNYPGDYAQKVKLMEKYISIVKENALDKNRKALIEKHRKKQELKNNIDILSTYVKLNRVNNRNFAVLTKGIQKESDRLAFTSEHVSRESFFFTQQMPGIRQEIENMKTEIYSLNQETLTINNEKMLLEKELMELNDEIKKLNLQNSELNTQKENIKNTLLLIRNHSTLTREKINQKEKETNDLISSLGVLAKKAKEVNENYKATRIPYGGD